MATKKVKQDNKDNAPDKPELREIATREKDLWRKPWGGTLSPNDATLTSRAGGKGVWLYDELERDTAVFAAINKRKSAVTSRAWQVKPASDDPLDVKAADMVRDAFSNINFDDACFQLLDAILKGFSVSEIMWDNSEGQTTIKKLIPRDQRRFTFDAEARLRLLTMAQPHHGEEVPDRKFIVHSVGAKDANPFGLGLGTRLFWPVWFRREGMEFWLTFADKYGSPTSVGKYPPGTTKEEQEQLLQSMSRIAQDSAITIPADMIIELLEASRGGSGDTYEKLMRYCEEMITQTILGDSNSARDSGGALAAAAIARNDVRLELSSSDDGLLCETLNNSVVPWLVAFNTPGARPPKVSREFKPDEDRRYRSYADRAIVSMGFRPTLDYITQQYGEGFIEAPELLQLGGDAGAEFAARYAMRAPSHRTTFAAPGDAADPAQAALDALLDNLPPAALNAQADEMLKPVIDAIMASDNYEAAFAALDEALPSIPTSALETALGQAMFVAETFGRTQAK